MNDSRAAFLRTFAEQLSRAVQSGKVGKGLSIHRIETISGPRVGILEINAGLDAGKLYGVLSAQDAALTRQFIPWDFSGDPAVFMNGRAIRIEAGWSNELAVRDIRVSQIPNHPNGGGRWVAGKTDADRTAVLGLNVTTTPHFLIAGQTGSGKTEAIRSAIAQLAADPNNSLVLVDGKLGRGLAPLAHVQHRAGPLATTVAEARKALGWAYNEMLRRYRDGIPDNRRVIVVLDEIQTFTGKGGDELLSELVKRLVTQGREARVHCIIGTQHPTMEQFSDSNIRTNLTGRVALRAESYKASEVIVGGQTPRADRLLGTGDAYGVTPVGIFRMQTAWIPERELSHYEGGDALQTDWPEFFAEGIGQAVEGSAPDFTPAETATAVVQAFLGNGRPTLVQALRSKGLSAPGGDRGRRLLRFGREVAAALREECWSLTQDDDCLTDTKETPAEDENE